MGNRTCRKGSVQSVLPMNQNTGIKLTTARYYTPKGRAMQLTGVKPDIIVDDTAEGNLFRVPREKDLKRHLENMTDATVEEEDDSDYQVVEKPSMFEFGGDDESPLEQAVKIGRAHV